jgi:hypothetical protein
MLLERYTVLTAKDFNKGPVTSADQMIQGKVAGLQTQTVVLPGEGATIRTVADLRFLQTMILFMLSMVLKLVRN